MESNTNRTVKGSNGKLYRDKQDNYRSYFLRMYLYIAHIWKMVIKDNGKGILSLSILNSSTRKK